MNGKVELYLEAVNLAEYGTWKCKFQSIDTNEIDCLELGTRGRNCLRRTNIELRWLILNGDNVDGLMNITNLGEKTVHEIIVEEIHYQLIAKTELVEALWTSSHLRKICIYLNAKGI